MKIDIEKINRLLRSRGMRRSEFCRRVGRTTQWGAGLWETKTTTLATIDKMAKVLGVDSKDLLK